MMRKDFYSEFVTALKAGYAYSLTENLPDPDPILRRVGHDLTVYNELRSDAKVAACIEQRKAGTLSLHWSLSLNESEGEDDEAKERLYILERALNGLDMPNIISGILEAFLWGFQPLEIMWELRDGLILPKDVVAKPVEWFLFDNSGTLKFRSVAKPLGEPLPERKFLLAQHHATFRNPYGQKVLPLCFWPVTFKKGGWRWWVSFTEKFGSPLLIGKYPRGISTAEVDALQDALERLFQQAVASVPNDSQIETVATGSNDGGQHKLLIDQCNSEIALAIVGQTLTSEIGVNGSYAAAQTHNEVRQEIVDGDKRMVERCIQQLVDWSYELNWSEGRSPRFSMWHEDDVDKNLAERDKILSETGVKFTKSYFQRVYGLQEEDFDIKEEQNALGPQFAEGPLKRSKSTVKGSDNGAFTMDSLDSKKLSEFGKAITNQVFRLIRKHDNFESVRNELISLYPKIDISALEDFIARAFYLDHIDGERQ